jgi:hypothetical protein
MFKCTQGNGKIAYQAEPCPDNANEQVLKASKRGEVKVVQPSTHSADDQNLNATPPTGARSSDNTARLNGTTEGDRTNEARADATTGSSGSGNASSPKEPTHPFELLILAVISFLFLASIIAHFWLIVIAFGESLTWGLLCIFIPLVYLLFVATHWDKAKKPFLISIGTIVAPIVWLAIYERAQGHHANVSDAGSRTGIYLAMDHVPAQLSLQELQIVV